MFRQRKPFQGRMYRKAISGDAIAAQSLSCRAIQHLETFIGFFN